MAVAEIEEFLPVPEVARRMHVTPVTVRRWIAGGRLHAIQLGGRRGEWRVSTAELARLGRGEGSVPEDGREGSTS
jgi:excisionase family DNA binding protein